MTAMDCQTLVRVRWDAETVYLVADLMRSGVPPSEQNLESLAAACERLSQVVRELGGDGHQS